MKILKIVPVVFLSIFCFLSTATSAQKVKTQTAVTKSQQQLKLLPDLQFHVTYLHADPQPVAGLPGRMKVTVVFVLNNTGNLASKPCTIQPMYNYNGIIHDGGDHGAGRAAQITCAGQPITIEAIPAGGKIDRSVAFTFNTTPDVAYGQTTEFLLHANYNNAFKEISITNNQSTPIALKIPAKAL